MGMRELSPDEDTRRAVTVDVITFDVCYMYSHVYACKHIKYGCIYTNCMCIIHG